MNRKNIAVILAGGVGSRFQSEIPKQFVKAAGKTILEHSVLAFEKSPSIDGIAIVIHPDYRTQVEKMVEQNGWEKIEQVLSGGKERYHSSLAAIDAYRGQKVNLLFHDAARPLVTGEIIEEVVKALESYPAVGVAVPSTDTVWRIDKETMTVVSVPDRRLLFNAQTPQAFAVEVIDKAYENALKDLEFSATDDCGVVIRYLPEVPVHIIPGSRENIKLTQKTDLNFAEQILQERQ